jgi:hypothetical protein
MDRKGVNSYGQSNILCYPNRASAILLCWLLLHLDCEYQGAEGGWPAVRESW